MKKLKNKIMKWLTDKRTTTYMVVPHNGGSISQLSVPRWGIRLLMIMLIIFMTLSAFSYYHYRLLYNKNNADQIELIQLRKVNEEQEKEIIKLNQAVIEIQKKLDKLKETDKKIQQLIN